MPLVFWLWSPEPVLAADLWPAGTPIEDAALLHATPEGLDAMTALLPAFMPERVDLEPMSDAAGYGCFNYEYSLTDAWVGIELVDARVVPTTGVLQVTVDLNVWVNDPGDKFNLYYEVFCSGEDCPGYVDPFPVEVTIPFSLAVADGTDGKPFVDATMGEIVVVNGLANDDIRLDCNINDLETVLNYFGYSIYDLIIEQANAQLEQEVEEQRAELEQAIEDAFASAYVDQDVDVGDISMHVTMYPSRVDITADGVVIGTEGSMTAEAGGCAVPYDPGGSLRTDGAAPAIADDPTGTHVGILVGDDFANQGLYALWRAGLFCYTIDASQDVGVPIDTSLLGLLGGEPFDALWPEPLPLAIVTDPATPPTVDYAAGHDVTIHAPIGLQLYAELDGRTVRALGVELDANIGMDVAFDATTGVVNATVDASGDAVVPRVVHNEFAPGTEAEIEANFAALTESFMGSLLGSALEGLSFALPSQDGFGLVSLDASTAGAEGDWLGLWAEVGPVTYTGDGEGCGGGCRTGGVGPWWLGAIVLLARRRARG